MNIVDLVLGGILLLGVVRGLFRGFVGEIFGLVGVVAGTALAFMFAPVLAPILGAWVPAPVAYVAALALLFVATLLAARLLGGFLTQIANKTPLGPLNRILGGVIGLFKAGIVVTILLFAVDRFPGSASLTASSRLAPFGRSARGLLGQGLKHLPVQGIGGSNKHPAPPPVPADSI